MKNPNASAIMANQGFEIMVNCFELALGLFIDFYILINLGINLFAQYASLLYLFQ